MRNPAKVAEFAKDTSKSKSSSKNVDGLRMLSY
jgi:hypothetical protein